MLEHVIKHKQRIDAGYKKLHSKMVPETIDYNMMFIDDHENRVVQVS